jgi:hypothetical protein
MTAAPKRQLTFASPAAPGAGGATKNYHYLTEHNDARRQYGFLFTDQRNATMACPYDVPPTHDPERPHKPIVFRAQSGANEGRLFWRCANCVGRDGKPGRILGLDCELEPSGKRLIEERNEEVEKERRAVKARVVDASGSVVAQGRGVDWTALEEKITFIFNVSKRIEARYDARDAKDPRGAPVDPAPGGADGGSDVRDAHERVDAGAAH